MGFLCNAKVKQVLLLSNPTMFGELKNYAENKTKIYERETNLFIPTSYINQHINSKKMTKIQL